ncbi:MAG: TonB-dependent receptor, partial [Saprospiraceae bacterium]|nr:TonB-dependent receptor [Saprospiraceae bacterium]
DFGTVKGFSFQYDLRRTNNIQLTANYTLQFADGTGSDADSQRGLSSRGNLRNLFPLNFDERHRIVTTIDYRYGSGAKYNGPTIAGKNILSNTGLNMQVTAVSGRPYTAKVRATPFNGTGTIGQINGSRLPWNSTVNLRIDKSFLLTKPDAKVPLNMNIYFRVQNLLDQRNIVNIYPATGSPSDDGYLISGDGIAAIEQAEIRNLEQAFVDAYNWRMVNPNFFSLPRRMYLGAIIDF